MHDDNLVEPSIGVFVSIDFGKKEDVEGGREKKTPTDRNGPIESSKIGKVGCEGNTTLTIKSRFSFLPPSLHPPVAERLVIVAPSRRMIRS